MSVQKLVKTSEHSAQVTCVFFHVDNHLKLNTHAHICGDVLIVSSGPTSAADHCDRLMS